MDGLREHPTPHAPVILITASHDARRRAAEVGADDHLGKPFDLAALLSLVDQHTAA